MDRRSFLKIAVGTASALTLPIAPVADAAHSKNDADSMRKAVADTKTTGLNHNAEAELDRKAEALLKRIQLEDSQCSQGISSGICWKHTNCTNNPRRKFEI